MLVKFMITLAWAIGACFVAASYASLNNNLQIRNAPGSSSKDTLLAVRRGLSSAALVKRDTNLKTNTTTLDRSWAGATLIKMYAYSFVSPKSHFPVVNGI
jgi:hypothetical protein